MLGTPSSKRVSGGRENSLASYLSRPYVCQILALPGWNPRKPNGYPLSFRLCSEKRQPAAVPEPCLSALAPAQSSPAGSESCNYPCNNYAWQKLQLSWGRASQSITQQPDHHHRCSPSEPCPASEPVPARGNRADTSQAGTGGHLHVRPSRSPSAPLGLASWTHTAPSRLLPPREPPSPMALFMTQREKKYPST